MMKKRLLRLCLAIIALVLLSGWTVLAAEQDTETADTSVQEETSLSDGDDTETADTQTEAAEEDGEAEEDESAETLESISEEEIEETVIEVGELPDYIQDLLTVAIGELGYTEESDGYTKYGAWTGDETSEWCAEFVCWCINMADQLYGHDMLENIYPYYTGQNTGRDWFLTKGRFVYRKGYASDWGWQWLKDATDVMEENEYIPYPGDLMYFSYNSAGDTVHVALVEYCTYDADGEVIVHVIEGNNPDKVQRASYYLDNSQVLGFGCWQDVVDTTMQFGNTGDKVLELQENLVRLGYLTENNCTGTYASNTRNAVSAFQEDMEDKTATGVADRETQQAIEYEILLLDLATPESWLVVDEE